MDEPRPIPAIHDPRTIRANLVEAQGARAGAAIALRCRMRTSSSFGFLTAALLTCGLVSGCAAPAGDDEAEAGGDAFSNASLPSGIVGIRAVTPAGKQTVGNAARVKTLLTAGGFDKTKLTATTESCFSGTNLTAVDAKGEEKARVHLCGKGSSAAVLSIGGKMFKTTYAADAVDKELTAKRNVRDILFGTYGDVVVFKSSTAMGPGQPGPTMRAGTTDAKKIAAVLAAFDLTQPLGAPQPASSDPFDPPPPNAFEGCTTYSFLLPKAEPFEIDVVTECGGKNRARIISTGIDWHDESGINVKPAQLDAAMAGVPFTPLKQ